MAEVDEPARGEPVAVGVRDRGPSEQAAADRASRRWRAAWRTHFYAGLFAMPFILLMSVTGLVILYTQPIQDALQSDLRTVSDQGDWVSFDEQAAAVEAAHPDAPITGASRMSGV